LAQTDRKTDHAKAQLSVHKPVEAAGAGPVEKGVQHALALEDPFPDQGHDNGRQQHGKEEHGPEKAARADVAVEDDRRQQRKAHHEAHLQRHEPHRVPDGAPELVFAAGIGVEEAAAIGERDEVSEPHIGAVGQQDIVPARGGVGDVEDHRKEGEEAEQDQVRRKKHPGEFAHPQKALKRQHGDLDDPHQGGENGQHGRVVRCPAPAKRRGPVLSLYSDIAAVRSSAMRATASSTVSSPTMAWLTRSTVMPNIARLPA
jgi:hypothetical protein